MQENMIAHVEKTLQQDLKQALQVVVEKEQLDITIPTIEVEVPREKSHGDYATNLALKLAGDFRRAPHQVAEQIVEQFSSSLVEKTEIAGPGFINFFLNKSWLYQTLELIAKKGEKYGQINLGRGERVQIEFVSANPTGPLHVGHSRGAVVGDVLAAVLKAAGYEVEKEYYINDAGNQMDILGKSALIRYQQQLGMEVELPENAYRGDYLSRIADRMVEEHGEQILDRSPVEQQEFCREYAYQFLLDKIKDDLARLGVEMDTWFSERTLHQGKIEKAIELLRTEGFIYENDGALWFKSTEFGDDKDRVVIKSDESPTYLAADIAYHLDKLQRGFDKLINIWGADHHGYIPRMKAVIEAFGHPADKLEVVTVQLVTLLRAGKKVPMSKRAGDFVQLREVVDEVGRDAARYFYIMRSADSHFDFDLDLAKEESANNPVYYVQYAHARIFSIFDNAELEDFEEIWEPELLDTEEEIELMKLLAQYPREVRLSAENRQPHYLTTYAYELASSFHVFYNKRRVITDEQKLSASRLYLVQATRQVLQNLLFMLGIDAPDQM